MLSHHPHPTTRWKGKTYHPPEMIRAIRHAFHRAQNAHDTGRLITPFEAMALAGPEARSKDTLYSIARDTAWEENVDTETLLTELEHHFPTYC